jgi:transcriptional antiterminator RfaH
MFPPSAELSPRRNEHDWYCVRTHMKHEHIAAAHLKQLLGVDAFNPQVRLLRNTRRGRRWVVESLFPCYVFAYFVLESMLERITYTPGVKSLVRFGCHVPQIPTKVIMDLQRELAGLPAQVLTDSPEDGEEVEVAAGPFAGSRASVVRVWPGQQRAQILIDVMGRPVPAELNLDQVLYRRKFAAQVALCRNEPTANA